MRPGDGWDLAIKDGSLGSVVKNTDNEFFSASDASKLTEQAKSLNGRYLRNETLQILNLIKIGAESGRSSIDVQGTLLDPVIKQRLQNLNYQIVVHAADQGDVREQGYITIKWG